MLFIHHTWGIMRDLCGAPEIHAKDLAPASSGPPRLPILAVSAVFFPSHLKALDLVMLSGC